MSARPPSTTTTQAPSTTTTQPPSTTTTQAPSTTTTQAPSTTTTAGAAPAVAAFSGKPADPDGADQNPSSLQIEAGKAVVLSWSLTAADGAELTDPAQSAPQRFDAATTSAQVTPKQDTQSYTLVAIAGSRRSAAKTVLVSTHPAGQVVSPHANVTNNAAPGSTTTAAPGGALVDLCAASLALTGPRPGCEGAQALHDKWLKFLDAAFPAAGVMAKDNRLAIETLNPTGDTHKTTCSQTLSNCFLNFGIPHKYFSSLGGSSIVPFVAGKYVHAATANSLPMNGDPYIIGGPPNNPSETHHAIFGTITNQNPVEVLSYAGGQSTYKNYQSTPDAARYNSKLQPQGTTKILIGVRPLFFYTDMWAFFNDHGAEVKDTGKMDLK